MAPNELDTALFFLINEKLRLDGLDPLIVFITEKSYIVIILLLALIAAREKRNMVPPLIVSLAALAVSDLASGVLKGLIQRPRPCDTLEGVRLLVICPESFSLPSGHASGSFAMTVPFYFLSKGKLKHALMVASVLIALSRPYVGVHYPSDVLFGAALGSAVAAALSVLYLKFAVSINPK